MLFHSAIAARSVSCVASTTDIFAFVQCYWRTIDFGDTKGQVWGMVSQNYINLHTVSSLSDSLCVRAYVRVCLCGLDLVWQDPCQL